jgi:hypothetical protein
VKRGATLTRKATKLLGLKLTEKGPDHATISINRVRRFRVNNIAEKIFDEILRQCVGKGLVGRQVLYTDSTHIKANANKHKKRLVTVHDVTLYHLDSPPVYRLLANSHSPL